MAVSNKRTLTSAWQMYAGDNMGVLVGNLDQGYAVNVDAAGHAESQHWNPDLSDQTILRNYLDRIGRLKGGTKILRE